MINLQPKLNQNKKTNNLSMNELIDLMYKVELSNNIVFVKNVYKIVRTRFLDSFKRIEFKTKVETTEQEILRKLYSIVNQKIETLEKSPKVHKLQKRQHD